MTRNQTIGYIGIALALSLTPLVAVAQVQHGNSGSSDAERALLPPYCQAKLGSDQEAKQLWARRMGNTNWLHLHHHCFGLRFLNQARMEFSNEKRKRFLLNRAVDNLDYVLARWPAEFPLVQEAQAAKLEAQSLLQ